MDIENAGFTDNISETLFSVNLPWKFENFWIFYESAAVAVGNRDARDILTFNSFNNLKFLCRVWYTLKM